MSNPFLGELRMFGGNFAPRGWAFCAGQLLAISQNDALYTLIGTTYGGDGQVTFGLPDLRGRFPVGQGQGSGLTNRVIGEAAGNESVTLLTTQMPAHSHSFSATTTTSDIAVPNATAVPATMIGTGTMYAVPGANTLNIAAMAANSVGAAGGSQPHSNIMPLLAINFIISLEGVFPSRN